MIVNKSMEDLRSEFWNALKGDDEKAQQAAFNAFAQGLQDEIIAKANENAYLMNVQNADEKILVERGVLRPLTSEEKRYFNAVIERKGFEKVEETFPKSIFKDIFKNLTTEHPLISRVDAKSVDVLGKMIFSKAQAATAFWGDICGDIKQMIIEGFEVVDIKSSRLAGFVPVCKGMLELGEAWLAQYVIAIITEIMAVALEGAIVNGTGKNQPIGMVKQLSGAVDSVYPDKPKVSLTDFKPKSLAGIRGALAKAKTDTGNVVVMVNPITYWSKIFPNLALQNADGVWVYDRLATGEEIIKSYAVAENVLIFGDPKNYFLGVAGATRIDRYEQTLAIEDMDLYIAKFYGYGMAKDKNAFFVADISGVDGASVPALEVTKANTSTPGV